ncbi:ATP-binding protein [Antarcticimicrobium sediminis]|nr:ATP-binding protein [Antarcticimicrobium sediminis]
MSHHSSHSFKANERTVRDGITTVMSQLRARGLADQHAGDVELALVEVVNNVVEHGYAGLGGGLIHIDAQLSATGLDLCVSDFGRPLPGGHVPPMQAVDLDCPRAALPEGGFGWSLIHQLTDVLRYERRGTRNTLLMRFFLTGPRRKRQRSAPPAP